MRLGLIAGRHPLPVEQYLLEQADASPAATPALFVQIEEAVRRLPWFPQQPPIDLFLTGLTRAALIAVQELHISGFDLTLGEWDAAASRYHATLHWMADGGLLPVADGLYLDVAG